jgi:hypothetical protein
VDFLLTLHRQRDAVARRHVLFRHIDNGLFSIVPSERKVVYVDSTKRLENDQWTVGDRTTLSVGGLSYQLEWTEISTYNEQLQHLLSQRPNGKITPLLDPTPRPGDIQIGQYTIQGPLERGSDGVVLSGVNRQTGEAVAVKRVQRTPADMDRIRLEEHITKDIGVHVSFPCTMNLY